MSAITAFYLNEMNNKLEGISSALSAQKFGLGEWKKSTDNIIPKEDLDDRTMLVLAVFSSNSGGGQMAMSFVPLKDFDALSLIGQVNPKNAANKCGTAIAVLNEFTGSPGTFYPKLTIGENTGAGAITFVRTSGTVSLSNTFWYTTL